jgi:hypothetical protein
MDRTHLSESELGTKDGIGAGDNDQPYTFGRRPRAIAPWPFTERQFLHLLVLRGRVRDTADPADRISDLPAPTRLPVRPSRRPAQRQSNAA